MKTFTFIVDPTHGWLEVSLSDIESTSVSVFEFSPYSFLEGETVYLEEDIDAGLFLLAYELAHGSGSFRIETRHVPTFDRNKAHAPGNRYDFERTLERCKAMEEEIRRRAA